MLFDSHCHLTDERLLPEAAAVVERARGRGVLRMVTVGSDAEDSARACTLAAALPGVRATAGIHPHAAARADAAAWARIEELARRPQVVALGETGLDYHYEHAPRAEQRALFLRHLALARTTGLPVVVHCRRADEDVAAILREAAAGTAGVLHCFDGTEALLRAGLEAGWYVSFSGLVTFPRYAAAPLVREVPADRLLIETDSPYLAPVPVRGRRNEPGHLPFVAEAVARLRGEEPERVAEQTWRNACALYRLDAYEPAAPEAAP